MGMMDAPAADPTLKPKQPAPPSGGMVADPNAGQQTPPPAVTTGGGQQTGGGMMTGGGQQTGGGGQQQPPPGPVQPGDWSSVYWNEALMKSIPGLRAQAEAARQRLGPIAAGSADAAGAIGSPTTALMPIPYVGPFLAGAGCMRESRATIRSRIGYLTGRARSRSPRTPPAAWPRAVSARGPMPLQRPSDALIKAGVVTAAGMPAHKLLGGAFLRRCREGDCLLMGVYSTLDDGGKWAATSRATCSPACRPAGAIKALTLGIGSAARTGDGPYNQWIPGQ